jgi:ribosomal protein S18 acetylase RimI-like enzyme
MKVVAATNADISQIANVHFDAFPGFFLTTLGGRFLEELYRGFLSHPSGILLVARDGQGLLGFAAGTSDPALFFRELRRRRWPHFLYKAAPAIVRNPGPVLRKIAYAARYRGDQPIARTHGALLSSIGVCRAAQGAGVAGPLISAFEASAGSLGAASVYLTTDLHGNDRVLTFYRKHGYREFDRFRQGAAREMCRLVKDLDL